MHIPEKGGFCYLFIFYSARNVCKMVTNNFPHSFSLLIRPRKINISYERNGKINGRDIPVHPRKYSD